MTVDIDYRDRGLSKVCCPECKGEVQRTLNRDVYESYVPDGDGINYSGMIWEEVCIGPDSHHYYCENDHELEVVWNEDDVGGIKGFRRPQKSIEMKITNAQRKAIADIHFRDSDPEDSSQMKHKMGTLDDFIHSAKPVIGTRDNRNRGQCAWCVLANGMYYCIETDGHIHT